MDMAKARKKAKRAVWKALAFSVAMSAGSFGVMVLLVEWANGGEGRWWFAGLPAVVTMIASCVFFVFACVVPFTREKLLEKIREEDCGEDA